MVGGEEYHVLDGTLSQVAGHDTMTVPMLDGYLWAILLQDPGKFVLRERHLKDILGQADISASAFLDEQAVRGLIVEHSRRTRKALYAGEPRPWFPTRIDQRRAVAEWVHGFLFAVRKSYPQWARLLTSDQSGILFPILRHAYGYDDRTLPRQAIADIGAVLVELDEFFLADEFDAPPVNGYSIVRLNQLIARAWDHYQPPLPVIVPQQRVSLYRRAMRGLRLHPVATSTSAVLVTGAAMIAVLPSLGLSGLSPMPAIRSGIATLSAATAVSANETRQLSETVDQLSVDLGTAQRRNDEQAQRLSFLSNEVRSLRNDKATLQTQLASANDQAARQIRVSQPTTHASQREILNLKSRLTDADRKYIDLATAHQNLAGRFAALEQQLSAQTHENVGLQQDRGSLQSEIETLRQQANALAAEKTALQEKLAQEIRSDEAMTKASAGLNARIDALSAERDRATARLAAARQEIAALQNQQAPLPAPVISMPRINLSELARDRQARAATDQAARTRTGKPLASTTPRATLASLTTSTTSTTAADNPASDMDHAASIAQVEKTRRQRAEGVRQILDQRFKLGTQAEYEVLLNEVSRGAPLEIAFQTAFGEPHVLIVNGLCRDFSDLCRK